MKTIRMLFTIALLLGAASIYTQAESQTLLAVSIPFGFTVGDQSFPAGDYTISDSFVHPETVIQLRSSDSKYFAVIQTHPIYSLDPSAKSELIFQRYGSVYFLSQIRTKGESTGRELLDNQAKALAKERSRSVLATEISARPFLVWQPSEVAATKKTKMREPKLLALDRAATL